MDVPHLPATVRACNGAARAPPSARLHIPGTHGAAVAAAAAPFLGAASGRRSPESGRWPACRPPAPVQHRSRGATGADGFEAAVGCRAGSARIGPRQSYPPASCIPASCHPTTRRLKSTLDILHPASTVIQPTPHAARVSFNPNMAGGGRPARAAIAHARCDREGHPKGRRGNRSYRFDDRALFYTVPAFPPAARRRGRPSSRCGGIRNR